MRWIQELECLRAAWEAQQPNRARGGYAALAGFHFQLISTLLQRVEDWCSRTHTDRRRVQVFDEMLSDALSASDPDRVLVTQAKRVLRSAALKDALLELWTIHRLAVATVPALAAVLRYEVRCTRSILADPASALRGWNPPGAADAASVRDFRDRVELTVSPNPLNELLSLLANRLAAPDPLGACRRWLGLLVQSAADGNLSWAAEEIWNDLAELQRDREASRQPHDGVYLWTAADAPPEEVRHGQFLTGQRVKLEHLREGWFAPRPGVYEPLVDDVQHWLKLEPAVGQYGTRLPVYWIGGRSGSGKSVALLHVAALLHAREEATLLLWLPGGVSQLPAAVHYALRQAPAFGDEPRRILIAVDDPYLPGESGTSAEAWRAALALLDTEAVGAAAGVPAVICCGPTEQAARFEEDFGQYVYLHEEVLPRETPADLQAMRQWFRQRTDREPPVLANADVLLVQVFFEWGVERSLTEFANRLRQRIERMGADGEAVFEFLVTMLAANRLYVGLPAGIVAQLEPAQEDIYSILVSEHHVLEEVREGASQLRLAHPHLAYAIYESWFPAGEAVGGRNLHKRREHLLRAIRLCLRYGQTPTERIAVLSAIAQALRGGPGGTAGMRDRLDLESLPRLLPEAFREFHDSLRGRIPPWSVSVWVTLRAHCPGAEFRPDPVEVALEMLATGDGGRDVFLALLQLTDEPRAPARARVLDAVDHVLCTDRDWYGWEVVASEVLRKAGSSQLLAFSVERAEQERTNPSTPYLLQAVLEAGQRAGWPDRALRARVRSVAIRWLESEGAFNRNWQFVWERLWEDDAERGDLRRIAIRWLREDGAGHMSWAHVWAALWKEAVDPVKLRKLGLRWLRSASAGAGARWFDLVWKELWNAGFERKTLRKLGVAWLMDVPLDNGSWSWVWQELWRAEVARQQLRKRGLLWLAATSSGHRSWQYVWKELWDEQATPELLRQGLRWLQDEPQHPSWPYVWRPIFRTGEKAGLVHTLGRNWVHLGGARHPALPVVWLELWDLDTERPGLRTAGLRWLANADSANKGWGRIWACLWEHPGRERDRLVEVGLRWLRTTRADSAGWGYLWPRLWELEEHRAELLERGIAWLRTAAAANPGWAFIWPLLWESGEQREELLSRGRAWLRDAWNHFGWKFVFAGLWEGSGEPHRLIALATRWLDAHPVTHAGWETVCALLYRHPIARPNAEAAVQRWFAETPPQDRMRSCDPQAYGRTVRTGARAPSLGIRTESRAHRAQLLDASRL